MRLREPGAGRGRKPTAVVVATDSNYSEQQVPTLSQRAEALGCSFVRNSGTVPDLGRVLGVLCHSPF